MARGKYETQAKNRRIAELENETARLNAEIAALHEAARVERAAHKQELADRAAESARRTIAHVEELFTKRAETLADGIANAAWRAQRVAMTEHLTWLFFKGYVKWDRFEGDREILQFLGTHGDLRAWFHLTEKYGHHSNYRRRRDVTRQDPIKAMIRVLDGIDRAANGDERARLDRSGLDAVVAYAREAFTAVELQEVMTDAGWVYEEPTEEQVALHREIMDGIPEFKRLAERVG